MGSMHLIQLLALCFHPQPPCTNSRSPGSLHSVQRENPSQTPCGLQSPLRRRFLTLAVLAPLARLPAGRGSPAGNRDRSWPAKGAASVIQPMLSCLGLSSLVGLLWDSHCQSSLFGN